MTTIEFWCLDAPYKKQPLAEIPTAAENGFFVMEARAISLASN
jgi:hypothetical protein